MYEERGQVLHRRVKGCDARVVSPAFQPMFVAHVEVPASTAFLELVEEEQEERKSTISKV